MDLDGAGRLAWELMTGDPPMPPFAALDWMREQLGTEDRAACVGAVCRRAGEALEGQLPTPPMGQLDTFRDDVYRTCECIRERDFVSASGALRERRQAVVAFLARHARSVFTEQAVQRAHDWLAWLAAADHILDLLRAMEVCAE